MKFKKGRGLGRALHTALLGSTAFMTLGSGAVTAQDAVNPPDATEDAVGGGIEDIVVTARKRVESTQDVPVSVTAISKQQIDRYDLTSLEKISASTPQLTIGRAASGSGASLVLRGIGSNTTSIGIEQSVAVVVDGVYYGQGRVINEGFFDLDRVEILKGPQALFFGKNATAGVVSLTTASPSSESEYKTRVGYEMRSQDLVGEAIYSRPLSDTLGVRIALRGSKMWGGYLDNKADIPFIYTTTDVATGIVTNHVELPSVRHDPKIREVIGRVTLKWEPTSDFTATLKASANINDQNNAAYNYAIFRCPGGVSQLNPTISCGKKFQHYQNRYPADIAAVTPNASSNGDLGNRYRAWAATATLEYDLGNVALTSVTNYNYNNNRFRSDGDFVTNRNGSFPTEKTSFHAFSSEARALTSFEGPINLMIGGYYQSTKRNYDIWTITGGLENSSAPEGYRYLSTTKDSQTKGETLAGFGQVTWNVLPKVEFAAGVRYTHETKDSYFIHPYSHPTLVALGRFSPNVRIEADQVFNNWSPEATITYKPTTDITIYGGYKTAYKSGGFSNSGILSPTASVNDFAFGPEKARGFEGGIKTTLFERQLRMNIGLFRYKYTDLQVDFFNAPVFAFTTFNAGSAVTKGVELELEYAPRAIEGLNLRGSINYNKARYDSFTNAPCYTGQTINAGCMIIGRPQQDLSGVPTAMAPEWTGSLGLTYRVDVGSSFMLTLGADARYSDDYIASAFGNPLSSQSSYANLDATIRLATRDEHWEVALIGKNLTNHFYVTGAYDAPSTGFGTGTNAGRLSDQAGLVALPRTLQLQLTWRY